MNDSNWQRINEVLIKGLKEVRKWCENKTQNPWDASKIWGHPRSSTYSLHRYRWGIYHLMEINGFLAERGFFFL